MANTINSRETRETSGGGTLDPSCLSRSWEGEKSHQPGICTVQSSGVRRQQAPYSLPSSTARASTSTSTIGCIRPRGDSRTHRAAPSRNLRATIDQVDEIMLLLNRNTSSEGPNELVCPVRGCIHKQLNGRIQDFRRHLGTHLTKNGEIRCKGVLWEQFLRDHLLFPNISMEEQPYTIPDEDGLWIGGCLKTFSRRDALKRHLRKTSCGASQSQSRFNLPI